MSTHAIVAAIAYQLMGHLTSLEEPLTFSSSHNASPAVEIIKVFLEKHGIDPNINPDFNWNKQKSMTRSELVEFSRRVIAAEENGGSVNSFTSTVSKDRLISTLKRLVGELEADGSIEGSFAYEKDGEEFKVRAMIRTGNDCGQGGMFVL